MRRSLYKMKFNQKSINNFKNIDLAYWIGVAQTDGYFKKQFVKSIKVMKYYIVLGVGKKSLPMLDKFIEISQKTFNIKGSMFKSLSYDKFLKYEYKFGCKNLLNLFKSLELRFSEPIMPPSWILEFPELFGAYLAGVIDGDGDVRVTRPKYLQCQIRISTSKKPVILIKYLKNFLNCGISSKYRKRNCKLGNKEFIGGCYETEFKVSKKNYDFVNKYILNNLALIYKEDKIKDFIKMKGWPAGFEPTIPSSTG